MTKNDWSQLCYIVPKYIQLQDKNAPQTKKTLTEKIEELKI